MAGYAPHTPSIPVTCTVFCMLQVYDVSEFIEKHPGGVDQLMLGAGRDVTILFESYHNFKVSK